VVWNADDAVHALYAVGGAAVEPIDRAFPGVVADGAVDRARLAEALGVDVEAVFVKGKTNEGLGWIGREEGLAVMAVATVVRATD